VNEADLPIVYYDPSYDRSFASIDWSHAVPEVLVPRLAEILVRCKLDAFTLTTVIYIAHVLGKIGHPMAVPVLIGFLEREVDFKFETVRKEIAHRAIFVAFEQIGTPEALEAKRKRTDPGIHYVDELARFRDEYRKFIRYVDSRRSLT